MRLGLTPKQKLEWLKKDLITYKELRRRGLLQIEQMIEDGEELDDKMSKIEYEIKQLTKEIE